MNVKANDYMLVCATARNSLTLRLFSAFVQARLQAHLVVDQDTIHSDLAEIGCFAIGQIIDDEVLATVAAHEVEQQKATKIPFSQIHS